MTGPVRLTRKPFLADDGSQDGPTTSSSGPSVHVTVGILVLIAVGVSLTFWPGHMDQDTISQIDQAKTGAFSDWWAPVLDAMWRVLFLVHLSSPGFVLLISTAVFVLSTFELLRIALSRWWAILVTLLVVAFPPVLGFLVALSRDTWFGVSALASYALLARIQRGATTRPRLMAALTLAAVWVALAARQNAVIALLPAIVMAPLALFPELRGRWGQHVGNVSGRWWVRAVPTVGAAVAVLVVIVVSQSIIKGPVLNTARSYPQQATFYMDLGNLSLRTGTVLIPRFSFPAHSLAVLNAHNPKYSWISMTATQPPILKTTPGAIFPGYVTATQYSTLEHDWLRAIEQHPGAYLAERWDAYRNLIDWDVAAYVPYNPTFAGGYTALFGSANRIGTSYLAHFTIAPLQGGKLFHIWTYLILGLAVSIDLLRRSRPRMLRIVGLMAIFAVLYYLGYFFLTNGNSFRYAWYTVTAVTIATVIDLITHAQNLVGAQLRTRRNLHKAHGLGSAA